ncbi:hypothetical protein FOXYSP1_08366 [Fusarium oxysporum f. sp. phaseoli]
MARPTRPSPLRVSLSTGVSYAPGRAAGTSRRARSAYAYTSTISITPRQPKRRPRRTSRLPCIYRPSLPV